MSTPAEEFLTHHGVVGMKWGKHKAKGDSGGSRKERRQQRDGEIVTARRAQSARQRKLQEAEGDFYVARTAKGQDKAEKIMRQREKDFFLNKDAATAAKLTSGEKRAVAIAYGAMGVMSISMIAASRMARY